MTVTGPAVVTKVVDVVNDTAWRRWELVGVMHHAPRFRARTTSTSPAVIKNNPAQIQAA